MTKSKCGAVLLALGTVAFGCDDTATVLPSDLSALVATDAGCSFGEPIYDADAGMSRIVSSNPKYFPVDATKLDAGCAALCTPNHCAYPEECSIETTDGGYAVACFAKQL